MPARRCLQCQMNYPYDKGSLTHCPECESVLQYSSSAVPDTEAPPEVKEVLPDLEPDARAELDQEWAALAEEARRRGPRWSVADLIAENVRRAT